MLKWWNVSESLKKNQILFYFIWVSYMFYYILPEKPVIDVPFKYIQYPTNHSMIYNIPILRHRSQKGLISKENLTGKKIRGVLPWLLLFVILYANRWFKRCATLKVAKEKFNRASWQILKNQILTLYNNSTTIQLKYRT